MKTLKFKMSGVAPLLMHNERTANPADPIARKMKEITGKRKKTDTDLELLQDLEWLGGLYTTEALSVEDGAPVGGGVPAIKGSMIESMLVKASQAKRLGKTFTAAMFLEVDMIPLEFAGPKDLKKLFKDHSFRDVRGCRVNNSKIMRTRPRFNQWGLSGEVCYIPDVLSDRDLREAFTHAGQMVGLGDYRPKFGRFEVEFFS